MISSSTNKKEIRKFGCIALIFFGVLSAIGFWRGKVVISYFFSFLSLIGFSFLLLPVFMNPVYQAWLRIGHFIGKVITILILTLAYYLVITPTALLKRIFGGRPIPILPDKNTKSYWVTRSEPAQPKERFFKRY